ncbi:MAG: symmetrical bis(5'-nucleosyl)-tetraphosphatase [Pseudomonadota bacterium]|nr:symmetrical bis(5'-nucleosyl)-tetraphosphatase [Pseudomonadota bacterium]
MATYFIGDVHGCYDQLMNLLELISYNSNTDTLWFCGDLVNKGPKSYETIKFVMDSKNTYSILGNHDLHFLALSQGFLPSNKSHNLEKILNSKHCNNVIEWLRFRPLTMLKENFLLVHAGIYPTWSIETSQKLAKEVESLLQGGAWLELLKNMYGNQPNSWEDELEGWERIRTIINIMTRMRFLSSKLELDFNKTDAELDNKQLIPWFQFVNDKMDNYSIAFGHWASLRGSLHKKEYVALDGGCVWGGKLIAYRLEDKKSFFVKNIL